MYGPLTVPVNELAMSAEIAGAVLHGGHRCLGRSDALHGSRSLIIGKEKQFLLLDGPSDSAAELILPESAACAIEVVFARPDRCSAETQKRRRGRRCFRTWSPR